MWFQMSLSSHQPATRSTGECLKCARKRVLVAAAVTKTQEEFIYVSFYRTRYNSAATCNTRFYSFSCVAILEGIGWQGSKCVTMKRVH